MKRKEVEKLRDEYLRMTQFLHNLPNRYARLRRAKEAEAIYERLLDEAIKIRGVNYGKFISTFQLINEGDKTSIIDALCWAATEAE